MSDPLSPELRDLLALNLVPGLGPRLTAALLERFGSARGVLQATARELRGVPHIGGKLAESFSEALRTLDLTQEEALLAQHGARLVARASPEYPTRLADILDPPHLLYLRGTLEVRDANAVAMVGSRSCTSYGRRIAERLAGDLARSGFTIVSGLARGIDGTAHRGALKAGGRTIAVLAGGLAKIYPPEHVDLAREVETQGAVLSESPMTFEPMAGMFPARNRLISGLSRGVIVVEAAERSGALITAQHAAEQGRPVFAVPGPVDSPASAGTLKLLRVGAILIRHAQDVVEELDGVAAATAPARQEPPPDLDPAQQRVFEFIKERSRHIDEMAQALSLPVAQLSGVLLMLEMKKVVRRLPGNLYERQ